jgi:hypothetical protein
VESKVKLTSLNIQRKTNYYVKETGDRHLDNNEMNANEATPNEESMRHGGSQTLYNLCQNPKAVAK